MFFEEKGLKRLRTKNANMKNVCGPFDRINFAYNQMLTRGKSHS